MNLKSKNYMQQEEFKERQGSFGFFCAQAFEFVIKFAAECRDGWKKLFRPATPRFENLTLALPFGWLTHREWQKKAMQAKLKI